MYCGPVSVFRCGPVSFSEKRIALRFAQFDPDVCSHVQRLSVALLLMNLQKSEQNKKSPGDHAGGFRFANANQTNGYAGRPVDRHRLADRPDVRAVAVVDRASAGHPVASGRPASHYPFCRQTWRALLRGRVPRADNLLPPVLVPQRTKRAGQQCRNNDVNLS